MLFAAAIEQRACLPISHSSVTRSARDGMSIAEIERSLVEAVE